MKVRPFQNVGVELYDLNISNLSVDELKMINNVFFEDLMVVIRNQPVDTLAFAKIAFSFGKIVNSNLCVWNKHGERLAEISDDINPEHWQNNIENLPVQRVTGMKKNGQPTGIFGSGKLDWHCNLNGITWAPGVGLQAVEGVEGTYTSWMDTTKAFAEMPAELQARCEQAVGHFEYSPEIWAEGLPEWQYKGMISAKKGGYKMNLVNLSERGKKGLYFHFMNKCSFPSDPELLELLKEHCFQEKYIHTLDWRPGDIHLSHQVLTLHRREQDDQDILDRRVLHRYTFDFSKHYPNKIGYLSSQMNPEPPIGN